MSRLPAELFHRRRDGMLILTVASAVVLALLTLFAIQLTGSLAKSRDDLEQTFRQRADLASALTASIFTSSAGDAQAQNSLRFGGDRVSVASLDDAAQQGRVAFLAVLDDRGAVVAASSGLAGGARARFRSRHPAVAAVLRGQPTSLSDIRVPTAGGTGVIEYAQAFPAADGSRRVLVTGFPPRLLSAFIAGYLKQANSVQAGEAYVLDSHGLVVGGTEKAAEPGRPVGAGLGLRASQRRQGPYGTGRWFASSPVRGSSWNVVLTAPKDTLFAPVAGARKWIPWAVFAAFALVALGALLLGLRLLGASDAVRRANADLAVANDALSASNDRLERRAAELSRSNAELEQFASIASHDLQEPLRKVRTFTDHLGTIEAERLSDQGRDYLTRTSNAAERMQNLIDDLLMFSRVATHGRSFAPVDLQHVAADVLDALEATIAEAEAVIHVGPLPTINGDAFQLRQLLQNLMSNAIKFRHDGVPPEVWIEAAVEAGTVHLVVSDNGIGFDPQYRTRIFNIFERLHGRGTYAGTGIGLALVRKIAERHNGSVVADSTPGSGATFTVSLPVDQEEEVIKVGGYRTDVPAMERPHAIV